MTSKLDLQTHSSDAPLSRSGNEDDRLRALRAEAVLEEVLDNIGEGFILFDEDDRLVVVNERMREWVPSIAHLMVPGAHFADLLRAGAYAGDFKVPAEHVEKWIRRRLSQFRNPGEPTEHQLHDGRWLLISERRTKSGGIAGLRTDITGMKLRELALKDSEARYRALAEKSMQGVLIHQDFAPLYMNTRFAELFGLTRDELLERPSLAELFTSDPRERAVAFENRDEASGQANDFAFSAYRADGRVVHLQGRQHDLSWEGAQVCQLTLFDVTERATADAHRKTMLDVVSAVATADDFRKALKSAVKAVCKNLGWAYGAAWLPEDDSDMQLAACWHIGTSSATAFEAHDRQRRVAIGEGIVGQAWDQRRPTLSLNEDSSSGSRFGLLAGLAVPVVVEHEVLAVLTFWTESRRYAEKALVEMIIAVADELGGAFRRKRMEQALLESEARFRNLIEGSMQGVIILDGNWQPLFTNEANAHIFGFQNASEMMYPDVVRDVIAPKELARLAEYRERRMTGQDAPDLYEFEGIRADGTKIWLQCLIRLIEWDNQPAIQASLLDVTARRQAEAESQALTHQIERTRRMEALGTLAGGVAHDINNALVPILGLGEVVAEELEDDEASRDCMQTIIESAEHIRRLTEQILAFSRAEGGAMALIDMAKIIDNALALLQRSLPTSVKITADVDRACPPVSGDATKLTQVVMNLMTNAAHAIGNAPGQIVLTYGPHDGDSDAPGMSEDGASYSRLTVIDTGPGIPEDVIGRIFEPFFTTKPVGEGTGLGLSVVHGIVTSLGGQIEACNMPGHGACFHVYLPQAGATRNSEDA